MAISAEFQQAIRDLMRDPPWDVDADTRRLANAADALPIGFDLLTGLYIRPDGAVGGCNYDEDVIRFREASPTALISALLFGAKRILQLRSLIPPRPDVVRDCSHCSGSGRHPLAKQSYCDACGGVGWIADSYEF